WTLVQSRAIQAGAMFTVGLGPYQVLCLYDGLPNMLAEYVNRAVLADQIDISNPQGNLCFVAIKSARDVWPSLVVAQRYHPADGVFFPAALVVPAFRRGRNSSFVLRHRQTRPPLGGLRRMRLLVVDS